MSRKHLDLTANDITLMINHINSFSRDNLNGLCPFDAAKNSLGENCRNCLE